MVRDTDEWKKLVDDLLNSKNVNLAIRASQIISKIANDSCVPDLFALLENDSFFVREVAADPLARLEGAKALPTLFSALTRGENEGWDNDTLVGILSDLIETYKKEALPLLLGMLKDVDKNNRVNAAWGLGFLAFEIPPQILLKLLREDIDPDVRAEAASSLGSFRNNVEVVETLLLLIQDKNKQIRISAISSLGYLGDKRAEIPLKKIMASSDKDERRFVEEALKQIHKQKRSKP